MYLTGATVTVSGASFTSCTAEARRAHNSRRDSRTTIDVVRQPTPNIPRHTTQHHVTPHLTSSAIITQHTSIPPEGQGTPLTSLLVMPDPSTRSHTHPQLESSSSSTPPSTPRHHRPRIPLFSPALLTLLSPPSLSYRFTLASTPTAGDVTTALCPIRSRTRCWVGLYTARCWRGVSVFRASSRSPSPCDP